jgi:hypothetical protein
MYKFILYLLAFVLALTVCGGGVRSWWIGKKTSSRSSLYHPEEERIYLSPISNFKHNRIKKVGAKEWEKGGEIFRG